MSTPLPQDARAIASAWLANLRRVRSPVDAQLPAGEFVPVLAELVSAVATEGASLLIAVPDDELLPALSNGLDLALRPLCLVLPSADFAAPTALRATLSLLKSRLARGGESDWQAAWEAQRRRIDDHAELWDEALAWCADATGNAWPARIGELFPAAILPVCRVATLRDDRRDIVVVIGPERLSDELARLLRRATVGSLLLHGDAADGSAGVPALANEAAWLGAELDLLTQQLAELELEFATAQAELAEFTRRYYQRIGARIEELDRLQAQIAQRVADSMPDVDEARRSADEATAKAERSQHERRHFAEREREGDRPFRPSSNLKRLFRHLAQKIHPDRATGEADRAWRSELMSEANRAYRNNDEAMLREILAQWAEGPAAATRRTEQGLAAQVARVQARLAELGAELNRLLASRLYELFVAEKLARARGRDLLQELGGQFDAQITAARERLAQFGNR